MIQPLRKIHRRVFFVLALCYLLFFSWHCVPLFMADSRHVAKSDDTPPTFGSDAMSHQYQAIAWNRQKRVYDLVLVTGATLYLTLFIGVSAFLFPYATAKTLIIRAAGSAAFLLLHIVLCIGRSAGWTRSFLPLLYNRRHLGVLTFSWEQSTAWPQSDSSTVSVIRTRSSVC